MKAAAATAIRRAANRPQALQGRPASSRGRTEPFRSAGDGLVSHKRPQRVTLPEIYGDLRTDGVFHRVGQKATDGGARREGNPVQVEGPPGTPWR